jgi:hypothetical protein
MQLFFLDCLTLEDEDATFLRNVGVTHQMTQRHIPEDQNPYQYRCENLRYEK